MNNIIGFLNNQSHNEDSFAAMFDGVFGNIRNVNIEFEKNGNANYSGVIKFPDRMGMLHNGYFIIINDLDTDYPNGMEVNVGDVIIARINKTDYTGSIIVYDESTVVQDTSEYFMIELGKIVMNISSGAASFEEVENDTLGGKERFSEYFSISFNKQTPTLNQHLPMEMNNPHTFSGKPSDVKDGKLFINNKTNKMLSIKLSNFNFSTSYTVGLNKPIYFIIEVGAVYTTGEDIGLTSISFTRDFTGVSAAKIIQYEDEISGDERIIMNGENLDYIYANITIREIGNKPDMLVRFNVFAEVDIKELV